ncbi:MAG: hypothetical protein AVDCRST_MAG04-1784, partial [uncultured Acetobacteraceae bacterium]
WRRGAKARGSRKKGVAIAAPCQHRTLLANGAGRRRSASWPGARERPWQPR